MVAQVTTHMLFAAELSHICHFTPLSCSFSFFFLTLFLFLFLFLSFNLNVPRLPGSNQEVHEQGVACSFR